MRAISHNFVCVAAGVALFPVFGTSAGAEQPWWLNGLPPDAALTAPADDRGAMRKWLKEHGINLDMAWVEEVAGNLTGGASRRVDQAGQYSLDVGFDFQRLFGLSGASIQIAIDKREGGNLDNVARLDLLQEPIEVYGRGAVWRLTRLYYDQAFAGGFIDWKIGKTDVGEDFAAFECIFMNLTFCAPPPGRIAGYYYYIYPVGQLMTRLRINPGKQTYFQVGAYQENPGNAEPEGGFRFDFSGTKGVLFPAEVGWTPVFGNGGLPGSYKLTAWYGTAPKPDVYTDINGAPLVLTGLPGRPSQGTWGASVEITQQLTHDPGAPALQGFRFLFTAVQLDRLTSQVDNQVIAGLSYHSPFAWRPDDEIAIAIGRTHVNPRVSAGANLRNAAVGYAEYPLEVYYNIHAFDRADFRPDFQWIRCPGGVCSKQDVFIVGLKSVIHF